jgi:hypothetical protein
MKIALMGYARSGKDTVGYLIRKLTNYQTFRLAFGEELQGSFHNMFPDIPTEPKPRPYYEQYGKAMRDIDINVWVNAVARKYGKLMTLGIEDFVITDTRQPNEAEWARQNGFVIVEIRATDYEREERSTGDAGFVPINPSEIHIKDIRADHIIYNNGTLEELEEKVIKLLKQLEGNES